jgi:hypothetical protein
MKLVHGKAIQRGLREVSPSSIAVAYVGIDWADYIDASLLKEIVLSPTLGTNPHAVVQIAEKLGWENVHFLDNLHAKFYLGTRQAAVGSFNLTANGLSAEGLEEAGFVVQDPHVVAALRELLESYKFQAMTVYPTIAAKLERLAILRAMWDRAVKNGVIRNDANANDLSAYRPVAADEIYVCCVWGEIEYNEEAVSTTIIKDAVSFLESDDVQPDRWILCWYAREDGYPHEGCKPYWRHVDEVLPNGALQAPYTKIAVERNDRVELPPPFELTESVINALRAVLRSGRFPEFLGNINPWSINTTLSRLPAFFEALRNEIHTHIDTAVPQGETIDSARQVFGARIREAMDISIQKKYVTHSIDGMLNAEHAVDVAKKLVRPGPEMKKGLQKLAKAKALHLSFESIMLEKRFESLFSRQDLDCARFNLREVDPTYQSPLG